MLRSVCSALLLVTAVGASGHPPAAAGAAPVASQTPAPVAASFVLLDINPKSPTHGKRLDLAELWRGRGMVLEFIASWCGTCRDKLPELSKLAEGGAPVVFVAADEYGGPENMVIVAARAGLTLPVLFASPEQAEAIAERFTYQVLPATYLIDRQGRVRRAFQGAVAGDVLLREVGAALAP